MDRSPSKKYLIDPSSIPFIIVLTLILGFGIGLLVSAVLNSSRGTTYTSQDLSSDEYISQIYKILQESYIDELPSKDDIRYGLGKGLVGSLNNEYTAFLTPEEAKDYEKSKNPDFEGIGVSLSFNGQDTIVESVIKGYPAESVGLKNKDILSKVDAEDVQGKLPVYIAQKIRGEKGTTVSLEVIRLSDNGLPERVNFEIVRQKIDIENITYENLGNGNFKITISQFVDETPELLNQSWNNVVENIKKEGDVKGVIVDLRNNPGGYVYSLRYILEDFLKSGDIIMQEQKKNNPPVLYKDNRSGAFEDVKLSVIVNEGTASASEIFASAVQDNNRGKVIGLKTVGKGVEQQVIELNDGALLIVVFQKWLTPSGRNITKESPVVPDFEIPQSDESGSELLDVQTQKALELLN
jgi:carboxyl-terminal processing protease